MFPKHWSLTRITLHFFCEALTNQKLIRQLLEAQMAAIDNLNTQVAALKADVDLLVAQTSAATEAQIQTAADAVAAIDTEVKAKLTPPAEVVVAPTA